MAWIGTHRINNNVVLPLLPCQFDQARTVSAPRSLPDCPPANPSEPIDEMNLPGQILPDSPFGRALTDLASKSANILEVGTWKGGGSTTCIASGMKIGASFTTVEADEAMYREFVTSFRRTENIGHIFAQWGTFHRSIQPLALNPNCRNIQVIECWDSEFKTLQNAPIKIALPYDLILLDGGEFTSLGDFLTLWPFAQRWIALDDTNPAKALKNVYAHEALFKMGWKALHDCPDDRNGWSIFEKP